MPKLKQLKASLASKDIAPWRKKGVLAVQLLMLLASPGVLISKSIQPDGNTLSESLVIFSLLVGGHLVAQLVVCIFVFVKSVPSYLWHAVLFLVVFGQVWSVFTLTLLAVIK